MDRPLISAYYYATYHYASIVRNVLHDQYSFLRHLDPFYGDEAYLSYTKPFQRYSALHAFIEFIVDEVVSEENTVLDLDVMQDTASHTKILSEIVEGTTDLPIDEAFRAHEIKEQTFVQWLQDQGVEFEDARDDHLYDFMNDLRLGQAYEDLIWQITQEVFFVLFQNRRLLLIFNEMMARQVEETKYELLSATHQRYFRTDGFLRRVPIPRWAMRAVYFRDRGICVLCRRDLSGLVNIWNQENYDHIVPLRCGGLNDVSNLQLLCQPCNQKKAAGDATTSATYEAWYDVRRPDMA